MVYTWLRISYLLDCCEAAVAPPLRRLHRRLQEGSGRAALPVAGSAAAARLPLPWLATDITLLLPPASCRDSFA
jgi:hypothetical protein